MNLLLRPLATSIPDVGELTSDEKLALMERLWESMSGADELTEPPAWHVETLSQREAEWSERQSCSQEWADARKEIKNKVA